MMADVDVQKPSEWYQILTILSASIPSFLCGALFAWTSPTISILISEDYPGDITLEEASYLTVIPHIVSMIAGIFFSRWMNVIGRKSSFLFTAVPQLATFVLIASSNSIYLFYVSRITSGIGDACVYAILPAYISEISTPKVRGTWGNMMSFLGYIGMFLMNTVGSYCSIQNTALIFGIVPVIFFVTFIFAPESPYFLLMKGRRNDAKDTLKKLLQKKNVDVELKQLEADVIRQISEPGRLKDLFIIGSNRKALLVSVFIRGAQVFSGTAAFGVYTKYIFEISGMDFSASTSTILFSAMQVIMYFFAACLLDLLGRRRAIFISCVGCAAALLTLGTYFWILNFTDLDLTSIKWFPIFWLLFFVVVYSVGLGVVPTLMLGEVFSASIKGHGLGIMNVINCSFVSSSTKLFQHLISSFGLYLPFLFFGCCCCFSAAISLFVVPETRGKTLEEIQQELKGNKKTNGVV